MDVTNRIVKICRRITDIEHALACNDQPEGKTISLKEELECLEAELKTLQPAVPTTEAPKPDIEKERDAFEIWLAEGAYKPPLARIEGKYINTTVAHYWRAWKARAGIDQ